MEGYTGAGHGWLRYWVIWADVNRNNFGTVGLMIWRHNTFVFLFMVEKLLGNGSKTYIMRRIDVHRLASQKVMNVAVFW